MIEVIPLGTGSALPSLQRHFSATAVVLQKKLFLFDCGEGTQYRLLEASLKASKLRAVFITHLHGDHYFGLPGLLSTLSLLRHEKELLLVGPIGLKDFVDAMPSRLLTGADTFAIRFLELGAAAGLQVVFESDACKVVAHPIEHSIPAFGFRFEEKETPGNLDVAKAQALGVFDFADYRRLKVGEPVTLPDGTVLNSDAVVSPAKPGAAFAYVTDTRPCPGGIALARNAQLVYHESTFMHSDVERAMQTMHATALEAATVAKEAGAETLILGHFSGRYKDITPLIAEARTIFKNTAVAEELKRYILSGGSPRALDQGAVSDTIDAEATE